MSGHIPPVPKPRKRVRAPKRLQAKKGLRPVNAERRAERFEDGFHSEGFVAWVRSLACSVDHCRKTDIEAAHAVSRGAGGRWSDVLPLCRNHHQLSHTLGAESFESEFGIDLRMVAAAVHQRWRQFSDKES